MSATAGALKRPPNRGRALCDKSPFSTDGAAVIREQLKAAAATTSAAIKVFARRGREGRPLPITLLRRRLTALLDLALFNTAVDPPPPDSNILVLKTKDVLNRSGEIFMKFLSSSKRPGAPSSSSEDVKAKACEVSLIYCPWRRVFVDHCRTGLLPRGFFDKIRDQIFEIAGKRKLKSVIDRDE